jgi:two-component system, OmpR family, KDP operon response regulator KdpE
MSGERILVCDDDRQILRALRLVLREAGYEVLTSETGEQALDLAAVRGPHAAVVDLMLPDMPGIEVCRSLREWSDIPIIVLSAVGEEAVKIEALQNGADDYVTKPFSPGELVARIAAVLRRAGRVASEPRVEADGLVIDLAAHRVALDDEEIRLTPIEFSLLRVLATNRGLLVTHRALLVEVWGPEYQDAMPLLRTHIANLRAKLASGGRGKNFIRTDAGIGYRFVG